MIKCDIATNRNSRNDSYKRSKNSVRGFNNKISRGEELVTSKISQKIR